MRFIDGLVRKAAGLPMKSAPEPSAAPRFESTIFDSLKGNYQEDNLADPFYESVTSSQRKEKSQKDSKDLSVSVIPPESYKRPSKALIAKQKPLTKPISPDSELHKESINNDVQLTRNDSLGHVRVRETKDTRNQLESESPSALEQDSLLTAKENNTASSPSSRSSSRTASVQFSPNISEPSVRPVFKESPELKSAENDSLPIQPSAVIDEQQGLDPAYDLPVPKTIGQKSVVPKRILKGVKGPETDRSSTSGEASEVVIEPILVASDYSLIEQLLARMDKRTTPQQLENGRAANEKIPQEKKDIRINIGSVEVKASQQVAPTPKGPVRNFDDYLVSRIYLDKRFL